MLHFLKLRPKQQDSALGLCPSPLPRSYCTRPRCSSLEIFGLPSRPVSILFQKIDTKNKFSFNQKMTFYLPNGDIVLSVLSVRGGGGGGTEGGEPDNFLFRPLTSTPSLSPGFSPAHEFGNSLRHPFALRSLNTTMK